ncbi:putative porin [Luteimonas sp. R10]|uniref:putative porin n=1 Tax=Luteimonas sp. R10 TaxID=3108176 RepID=UPI00308C9CB1|nr:putative porin [Luteimonas sp. R10]
MKTAGLKKISGPFKRVALVGAIGLALVAGNAQAQQAPGQESTMVKLIRSLIDSGALEPDAGRLLLEEAMGDGRSAAATPAQPQPGDVRVPYIPQTVRDEIREEVKAEVLAQAREERWAAPDAVPEWTQRIRVEGDVRVRNESRLYSDNNSDIEVDWGAINAGSGYDVNPNTNLLLPPLRNTREDRTNSWRIRARLGITADLGEHTQAGVRLATGNDNGPVSTTQTLGGGLEKKDAWIDQAWIAWSPADWLRVVGGRFDNPYWSTETVFSNDLNFDGIAFAYSDAFYSDGLSVFATLGLTPLEYSSDNFPGTSREKAESRDKWLNGLQLGAEWAFNDDHRLRGALAYYDFRRITGRLSEPCALYAGADHCSTDWTRPAFMQKGNTLMLLRDISLDPIDPANTPQPQYVGLASEFELLDMNLRYTLPAFGGYGLQLDANWVRNMAYDAQEMWERSRGGIVTNLSAAGDEELSSDNIESGDTAYQFQATFGLLQFAQPGDWNAWLGYRRIDPDALPDAYNDSDFHLGGTNAKGYYLGASWMFDKRVWLNGSWFAAKEVFGPPLSIDVFQLEVNAKF